MQTEMMMDADESNGKKLSGTHVLLIFLAFFGVMFAVNGIFLHSAITSFPGEDVDNSYVQGIDYNSTLAARSAQAELGWTAEAGLAGDQLIIRLADAEGDPLSQQTVSATLRHASDAGLDRDIALAPVNLGEYAQTVPADVPGGVWTLKFEVRNTPEGEIVFTGQKSVMIP